MALKFIVNKLEDVPEAVRNLYRPEGEKFVLDAEGAVSKDRLDEFRNTNIQLTQQLDKLKDVDPVKYRELLGIQQKIQEKQLIEAGKVDEVVELRVRTMREEMETTNASVTNERDVAVRQLSVLMIDNAVKTFAIKHGVLPTAVDDVVLRAKAVFTVENGQPVPKSSDGKVIYGKDGKSPMPVDEWVQDLRKVATHLFQGSAGSGAGGGTNQGRMDLSKMSAIDKINIGMVAGGLLPGLPGS